MQLAKLQKDMMEAMKAHDKARKESISVLYSAAKKLGIDNGCRDNVPEEMVDQAILKEVKSVKEQIETCPAERTELLEEYKARLAVFEEYAPKMLSADEVENLLTYSIPGTGTPVWKLGVGGIELIILGILVYLIISDLKVIRWFENKKKSRL